MGKCPSCGSTINDDNAVFIGRKLEDFRSWDAYEGNYQFPEGKTFTVPRLGDVTIVKKSTEGPSEQRVYDGYSQGTEFETFMIFQVAGRYFRKDGTGDSYGTISWDGLFREVFPQQKTITVYDFDTAN